MMDVKSFYVEINLDDAIFSVFKGLCTRHGFSVSQGAEYIIHDYCRDNEEYVSIREKVKTLEGIRSELQKRIDKLERRVANLDDRVSKNEEDIEDLS